MKRMSILVLMALCLMASHAGAREFEPHVLVYAGRLPGYAEALAEIINETETRAIVADADSVVRALTGLPQTGCVVIAALNPSDFVFLREFAPVLLEFYEEGGSFVGLGSCCTVELDALSSTIFPIGGNATVRGKRTGDYHGSTYYLSEEIDEITEGLPDSFVITQEKFTYRSGPNGPLEPSTNLGTIRVIYREKGSGLPLLVTMEGNNGGRSVSLPGCFVVGVDRLPFYWGNLISNPEFRELLKNSVSWAMAGSKRFEEGYAGLENALEEESSRLDQIRQAGEKATRRANQQRNLLLLGMWLLAIVFQGFLVFRFILPRFRSS